MVEDGIVVPRAIVAPIVLALLSSHQVCGSGSSIRGMAIGMDGAIGAIAIAGTGAGAIARTHRGWGAGQCASVLSIMTTFAEPT